MADNTDQEAWVEEVWRQFLVVGAVGPKSVMRNIFLSLPSDPRCPICSAPFHGLGGHIARVIFKKQPSSMNPKLCNDCDKFTQEFRGGIEVEISMLFADVRGSTTLAEEMNPSEYAKLLNRFYKTASNAIHHEDGLIDKLVGDEVVALFVPGVAGEQHSQRAVKAALNMLEATGHSRPQGPWIPIGVGVHTGKAFVGSVGSEDGLADFTAIGDAVNVAARLAGQAKQGEIVISEETFVASKLNLPEAVPHSFQLKGREKPVDARVVSVASAAIMA